MSTKAADFVMVDSVLGKAGVLAEPVDVAVAGRTRTAQLALEVCWHPRGEDHPGFARRVMWDIAKLALAKSRDTVEQSVVVVAAPAKFWRWLPSFGEERPGYDLLDAGADEPASAKSEFLSGPDWDSLFQDGLDTELPERLWTQLLGTVEIRSPWAETEVRYFEVKGLGSLEPVRA